MKKLIEGLMRFKSDVYPKHRELFAELASRQNPEVMMIACSDSRVVPNVFTQSGPGELFVLRNAGNIVPAFGEQAMGVSATIEYAVQVLKVKDIIVCGHTDCGAMRAALHPETMASLPSLSTWLRQTESALAVVKETASHLNDDERLVRLIEENVLAQLDRLATHPIVAAKTRSGALHIHGWVYDIAHGEFNAYDPRQKRFVPLALVADELLAQHQPVDA